MQYIYKEYSHIFDTPAKREQERVVVNKIMDLLNKNKYDDIHEFINKNNTYQDFLKNNSLENVVKHFGNTLSEEDFTNILHEIVSLTNKKQQFESESIKTTKIEDKEYNSYEGKDKTFFLDNTHSNMSIERQLEELQPTEQKFQTSNTHQNTENMMMELEENKKESLNLSYLNQINMNSLNDRQKKVFQVAVNYQLNIPTPLRVDIDKEVIVDSTNNLIKIEENMGQFTLVNDKQEKIEEKNEPTIEPRTLQKTLIPSTNTIYSSNIN